MDNKSPFLTHFEYLISNFFIPMSFLWQMQKVMWTPLTSLFDPVTFWLLALIVLSDVTFWVLQDGKKRLTVKNTYEAYNIYFAYMFYSVMATLMFLSESHRQPFSLSSMLSIIVLLLMVCKFMIFKRITERLY